VGQAESHALLFLGQGGAQKRRVEPATRAIETWRSSSRASITPPVQARLGHSTSVAAQLYQHAAKDRDRQIVERLSKLVEGAE
jgi:hypothetical protein